jgi:hypothetical protein
MQHTVYFFLLPNLQSDRVVAFLDELVRVSAMARADLDAKLAQLDDTC